MSQIKGLLSPLLESWRMKKASKFIVPGSVLDLGCGEGELLKFINPVKYLGIDCDVSGLNSEGNIEFRHAYITESLGLEGRFDNIVMLAIIEHLDNPEMVLKKLVGNLSENGRIIITTPGPLAQFIHALGAKVGLFDRDARKEHKVAFGKEGLYWLAGGVGLKVTHYSSFEFGLNNLIVMAK